MFESEDGLSINAKYISCDDNYFFVMHLTQTAYLTDVIMQSS